MTIGRLHFGLPPIRSFRTASSALAALSHLAAIATMLVVLVTLALPAAAADGDIDLSFGTAFSPGFVFLPLPPLQQGTTRAAGVRSLPDGRILVLSDYFPLGSPGGPKAWLLHRLLSDGTLDTTFGVGGVSLIHRGTTTMHARALELGPLGTIYVGGYTSENGGLSLAWAIARLLPEGSLDSSFGFLGWALIDFPSTLNQDVLSDLVVGADGSTVAVGATNVSSGVTAAGFARLTANGVLDPAFGASGLSSADLGVGSRRFTRVHDALIEPGSGAVVFVGHVIDNASTSNFQEWGLVGRLTPDGILDPSFGAAGAVVLAQIGSRYGSFTSIVREANGDYRATGTDQPGGAVAGWRARLRPDGAVLGSQPFYFGGSLTTYVAGCAADAVGRVVCIGETTLASRNWVGDARFVGDDYDAQFRGLGRDYFGFPFSLENRGADLDFDPSHRILVAGTATIDGSDFAVVTRLLSGPLFVDGFESGDLTAWSSDSP